MLSNLPPGCSSADGGIDHEFEAAIDALVDKIPNTHIARMLIKFLDAVEATYDAGYADGEAEERMMQGRLTRFYRSVEGQRCSHGVRLPHECKQCADEVPPEEIAEWMRLQDTTGSAE